MPQAKVAAALICTAEPSSGPPYALAQKALRMLYFENEPSCAQPVSLIPAENIEDRGCLTTYLSIYLFIHPSLGSPFFLLSLNRTDLVKISSLEKLDV